MGFCCSFRVKMKDEGDLDYKTGCFLSIFKSGEDEGLISNNNAKRVVQLKNTDIRKDYEFISRLGVGAFGKVRLYRDKNYKELLFAIKTLKKEGISEYQFNLLVSEVEILKKLDHPNIVKYFGAFENDYFIHIIMEYLKGQDLNKIISMKKYTRFDEKDMCKILQQLLKALCFIHRKNIVHRDIKPENIVFSDKSNYSTLRLIDFGLATESKHDHKSVGTPFFMSPEMIVGKSTTKSDVWSVGVIAHLMLTEKYPFYPVEGTNDILQVIKECDFDSQYLDESECSDEAKSFVKDCLVKEVSQRMSSEECLKHPWITKFCPKNIAELPKKESISILLNFAEKTALQKEIYFFLAKISREEEIVKIKDLFNELDTENMGALTKEFLAIGFKHLKMEVKASELTKIWEGLDFHQDGEVTYTEFLAAMISSSIYNKEEKILSVFNLLQGVDKSRQYITFESLKKAAEALKLRINQKAIKECFDKLDRKELRYDEFKKMIGPIYRAKTTE